MYAHHYQPEIKLPQTHNHQLPAHQNERIINEAPVIPYNNTPELNLDQKNISIPYESSCPPIIPGAGESNGNDLYMKTEQIKPIQSSVPQYSQPNNYAYSQSQNYPTYYEGI